MRLLPALGLPALLLLALLSGGPARAQNNNYPGGYPGGEGQWTVKSFACQGQTTVSPANSSYPPYSWPSVVTPTYDQSNYVYFDQFAIYPFGQYNYNQTLSGLAVDDTGSITPVLTWTPAVAGDTTPPPDKVFLQVTPDANASAYGNTGWYFPGVEYEAADGFGDAPVFGGYSWNSSGSHLIEVPNPGQSTTVRLPSVSLHAHGTYPANSPYDEIAASVGVTVQQAPPPKSILISRHENSGANIEADREFFDDNSGEWTGYGDSVFSNDVYGSDIAGEAGGLVGGADPGWDEWDAGFAGAPWPSEDTMFQDGEFSDTNGIWDRQWHWYAEDGSTQLPTALGSDAGTTYAINPFIPHIRPHVDWPWNSDGYIPHDMLDEMTSPNAPAAQGRRINLHLTDQDLIGSNPQYNFDHHANFGITYHNRYELLDKQPTTDVPVAENPWKLLQVSTGTLISPNNTNVFVPGIVNLWNPQVYYNSDNNWNITVTTFYMNFSAGQSSGGGLYMPITPRSVPAGDVGVVYYRPHLIRNPFTYRWYTAAGRKINYYDANGNEVPFSGSVDISSGGYNTNNMIAEIVLYPAGTNFWGTLKQDGDPTTFPAIGGQSQ